jgi:hypothetical protein
MAVILLAVHLESPHIAYYCIIQLAFHMYLEPSSIKGAQERLAPQISTPWSSMKLVQVASNRDYTPVLCDTSGGGLRLLVKFVMHFTDSSLYWN